MEESSSMGEPMARQGERISVDSMNTRRYRAKHWDRLAPVYRERARRYRVKCKRYERTCTACGRVFRTSDPRTMNCSLSCGHSIAWKRRRPADRVRHTGGYWLKRVAPDYPGARIRGGRHSSYILEHRWVMEQHLGRLLEPRERVHHKNGRRGDNRFANLELWTLDHNQPVGVRVLDVPHCPTCCCGLDDA